MRNRFFLVIFVFVVLGLGFEAHAERVLLVRGEGAPALKELIAEIEAAGGRAPHVFPPGAAIVEVPDGALPEWSGVEWVDHLVDVDEYAERGFWGRMAAVAWNTEIGMVFEMPPADRRAHEARLRSGRTFPPMRNDALLPPRHKPTDPAKPADPKGSARGSMQVALPESLAVFADSTDTSEFMLGSVAVAIFLMESTGSTYNWSSNEIDTTLTGIYDGLDWWVDEGGAGANLSFVYEVQETTASSSVFSTTYEPITMDLADDYIWINQAMIDLGYWSGNDAWTNVRFFDDNLRTNLETDWAFSIFVADSNPMMDDGLFADDQVGHAYFGGPWFAMSRYSPSAFNSAEYYEAVPAHETGHIFYATDEYHYFWDVNDEYDDEYSGYLNVLENTGSSCMMSFNVSALCNATPGQVGWRDTDSDGIFDILDTEPATQLGAYPVDPTTTPTLSYSGSSTVVPLTNLNPKSANQTAITLNTIANVQYRVNSGPWQSASGTFDGGVESYSFQISPGPGTHTVEARAINSVGNLDATPASDTVTILGQTLTVIVSGDGTVTSDPVGIDCGNACSDIFVKNSLVFLTATPYSGESFSGWSGDGCLAGQVTMGFDRSCTATFTVCDEPATITVDETLSSTTPYLYKACQTITGADDLLVASTADVTFAARDGVYLQNGVSVESGAEVHVRVGINAL